MFRPLFVATTLIALSCTARTADSLTPYTAENVPQSVVELWKDVDARKDPLETEVVQEWKENGVVCRYVIFKIGTFKGANARLAAFYTFPEGMTRGPAFVWCHGGGQRADRERGAYFARHGYATLDINWGGREIAPGITANTDWGKVDPSQGPQFYAKALRQGTKLDLKPDEHTLDPVVSPRNGNWFLLTYAARRAITFLEEQPEVDPAKIGFTGYSMGGNVTSYVAIDARLKAVAPMVGGAGFITSDFPGVPDSGRGRTFGDHAELFARTMESQSYYPHVKAPVLMLSATNDFHAPFEYVFQAMDALPHDEWRVSQKLHYNHNLGAEQWILLNLWFGKYLKGEPIEIPQTAPTTLALEPEKNQAVFTVKPDQSAKLRRLAIYFSHDPNPRSRFWNKADAVKDADSVWSATVPLHANLPLYVFANCTYPLGEERESFDGATSTYTITSTEQVHLPAELKMEALKALATREEFLPGFDAGWGEAPGGGLLTYKFRDPAMQLPGSDRALRLKLTDVKERIGVRFRVTKNKYVGGGSDPQDFVANALIQPGTTEVIASLADFVDRDRKPMADWSNIATLALDLIHQGKPLQLRGNPMLKSIEWTDAKPQP